MERRLNKEIFTTNWYTLKPKQFSTILDDIRDATSFTQSLFQMYSRCMGVVIASDHSNHITTKKKLITIMTVYSWLYMIDSKLANC